MSIKDEITKSIAEKTPQRYPDIVDALKAMSKGDREAVLSVIGDGSFSAAKLAQIITDNGHKVRADSIRALRRGDMKSVSIEELRGMF